MNTETLTVVAAIVSRIVGQARTPAQPARDTRLSQGYLLDSVELLEVVIASEQAFGITFDEQVDFRPGTFETLGSLVDLVERKRAEQGRSA